MIIIRYFIYERNNKFIISFYTSIITGIIIIPKGIEFLLKILKVDINTVPYLKDVIDSVLYRGNLFPLSKNVLIISIILSIILLVIKIIMQSLTQKISNDLYKYVNQVHERNDKISKENDLKVKIMKEKANNIAYIKYKRCGSDNLVEGKFGTCKPCRSKVVNTKYKK